MKDWIDSMEARTKAQAKYDKTHTLGFYMKLNLHTDQDILRWLWGQPSKQGAVKKLIREEIARNAGRKLSHDGEPVQDPPQETIKRSPGLESGSITPV